MAESSAEAKVKKANPPTLQWWNQHIFKLALSLLFCTFKSVEMNPYLLFVPGQKVDWPPNQAVFRVEKDGVQRFFWADVSQVFEKRRHWQNVQQELGHQLLRVLGSDDRSWRQSQGSYKFTGMAISYS